MKTKNILIIIVILLLNIFEKNKYDKLEKTSNKSIKQTDLPNDFSENALKTINEFIQKNS